MISSAYFDKKYKKKKKKKVINLPSLWDKYCFMSFKQVKKTGGCCCMPFFGRHDSLVIKEICACAAIAHAIL